MQMTTYVHHGNTKRKVVCIYIYTRKKNLERDGVPKSTQCMERQKSLPLEAPSPFNSISWSSKILQRVKFFDQPVLSNKTFSNLVDAKTVHLLKVLINLLLHSSFTKSYLQLPRSATCKTMLAS